MRTMTYLEHAAFCCYNNCYRLECVLDLHAALACCRQYMHSFITADLLPGPVFCIHC